MRENTSVSVSLIKLATTGTVKQSQVALLFKMVIPAKVRQMNTW